LGNADILRERSEPASFEHDLICSIEHAAKRASELCEQMLAYAGQAPLAPTEIDLSQLVDDLVPALREQLGPNTSLQMRLAHQLPTFRGDRAQIERVVVNLVANASEALGRKGGSVQVSTGQRHLGTAQLIPARIGQYLPSGDYVVLDVHDEGEGIANEHFDRIFEPFYSTRFAGRGLGLAATHGIVKAHGGGIRVRSTAGEGTSMQVLFPLHSRLLPVSNEFFASQQRPDRGFVLVADDDQTLRREAVRGLVKAGFEVRTAEDGGEALRLFAASPNDYRLVILDLAMPNMNGDELLQAIRRRSTEVPVLLCSRLAREELTESLPKDPQLGFLEKPYRIRDLVQAVHLALSQPC
jgi:CheY-like chemotaxis protein